MMKRFLLICMALLLVTGCESVFGKESGVRGALPGKRENVFSTDRALKPDPSMKGEALNLPAPEENKEWNFAGGSLTRAHGHLALGDAPSEAWSTSIGAGTEDKAALLAEPIIGGDKIFTIDSKAHITALTTDRGKVVWELDIPDPRPDDVEIGGSGLGYINGKLIATTNYGNVAAIDAATGKVLWQKVLPAPIRSAPVVDGDRIYISTIANVLYDVSLADGSIGWSHQGLEETASLMGMASPLPAGEIVIAPFTSGQVAAVRKLNGGMVWEESLASSMPTEGTLPAMSDIQGEPVLDNGRLYVASHSGRLMAADIRSGQRVWEADAGSTEMPWVAGDTVFVITIENQLAALATQDGRVRWVVDLPRYDDPADRTDPIIWTGPVLAGNKLWLANSLGQLHSYDPRNGKELSQSSVGRVYLPLVVANRTLYILSKDGTLTAYR